MAGGWKGFAPHDIIAAWLSKPVVAPADFCGPPRSDRYLSQNDPPIAQKVYYIPRLSSKSFREIVIYLTKGEETVIDYLDEKIIEILKRDSRRPFVDIANQLKVSEGTIRSRVRKLVDDNIIQSFTIKTSSKNVKAIIEIKINVNVNTSDVAANIAKFDGVSEVFEVTGEEDVVAIIDVTSSPQLNEIIERIRRFDNVQSTRTRLILKEHFGGQ
jgi:Lrp/AsnC family transcriptional regulator, regulator for asnA, asnC and gidA